MALEEVMIHGHRISFRRAGEGPVVLLVHGMAGSSETWEALIPALARSATVIAPDLIGHGSSAKPIGDYSLGSLASHLRDLLVTLGYESATVVGHSLGGGVAMQFAYQFPERCERLVLVGSGGLGKEVHILLRALSIPGAEYVLSLGVAPGIRNAGTAVTGWLGKVGLLPAPGMAEIWRSYVALGDAETRAAFMHTLRAVIDPGGQRVSARDRLYLASEMPTMIAWGDRDPIIPVKHAYDAHDAMPGSILHIYEDAGHYPHRDYPNRFSNDLIEFIGSTQAAKLSAALLRAKIQGTETKPQALP
jgi:pimeloyl-ACP methyl ester carboxylesterase